VYWQYGGRGDASTVQNVGLGGLFLKTARARPVDSRVDLHLVVHEGQIRTEAIVRHVIPGVGLGLEFTAIKNGDRPHLLALITRLRKECQLEHRQATLAQYILRPSFSS
jgi:hypothetical protein